MNPSTSGEVLLELDAVEARRGRQKVLRDIRLTISRGEIVAVLGPNGAGKSTLLETLGGLIEPSSGTIVRHGRVATLMQTPGLARRSALANVELALAWWGVPRGQRRGRALQALDQMRAGHLAHQSAASMSGGERRRVHLARGVATSPDILLLDEPFAGLDPTTHAALCDDASSALRTSAGAVVLVVHDRSEAWAMADRFLIMMDGRIVADGSPQDVLDHPPSRDVAAFLGYDGEMDCDDGTLLTRPANVQIDPLGDLISTVTRVVCLEDGVRVDLDTGRGTVRAITTDQVTQGEHVRIRLTGGAKFVAS